jgi:steroid delta-isomerase-like uncharacterized protein
MPNANEAIVRRLIEEVFNRGETGALAEVVAVDHVGHGPFGDHYGPDGIRLTVTEYRVAFPDLQVTIEDLVAAGDRVARRFTVRGTHAGSFIGIPPTGRAVTVTGIAIDRFAGGRVAESWISIDTLNLLRQLGVSPSVRGTADAVPPETVSSPGSSTMREST